MEKTLGLNVSKKKKKKKCWAENFITETIFVEGIKLKPSFKRGGK